MSRVNIYTHAHLLTGMRETFYAYLFQVFSRFHRLFILMSSLLQAVTETATDLMPVWNARCQMLSHAADTPWLSDTDRKLLRLLLTCSKFFDTLTEEFLLRVEVLMSKVTGNVGPVAIQRAALRCMFTLPRLAYSLKHNLRYLLSSDVLRDKCGLFILMLM